MNRIQNFAAAVGLGATTALAGCATGPAGNATLVNGPNGQITIVPDGNERLTCPVVISSGISTYGNNGNVGGGAGNRTCYNDAAMAGVQNQQPSAFEQAAQGVVNNAISSATGAINYEIQDQIYGIFR